MILEPVKPYKCKHITLDYPSEPWEIQQYWSLRQNVFVKEQQIFQESDKDTIDLKAIPIIAKADCMGMSDQVVGVVRIDEREPGVWWGSRLAVCERYRTLSRFTAYQLFENNVNAYPFTLSIGASLIFKAVTTAAFYGCNRFMAHVQIKNVRFFERMHWNTVGEVDLFGHKHALMKADLDYYPATSYITKDLKSTG